MFISWIIRGEKKQEFSFKSARKTPEFVQRLDLTRFEVSVSVRLFSGMARAFQICKLRWLHYVTSRLDVVAQET